MTTVKQDWAGESECHSAETRTGYCLWVERLTEDPHRRWAWTVDVPDADGYPANHAAGVATTVAGAKRAAELAAHLRAHCVVSS